jgi:ABC-type multidrug transport system permease subunit
MNNSWSRFLAIFGARNLEFFRDRAAFFWNLLLPIFFIFGFAIAFSGRNTVVYKVGTVGNPPASVSFLKFEHIKFIPYPARDAAVKRLVRHQLDMVLDFGTDSYLINTESPNGYLVEKILLSDRTASFVRETVTGKVIRYVDWFIPGVIGMNILFGSLSGVGYVIVRYRKNGVLKRFKATPLRATEFVGAQIISRFFIVVVMAVVVFLATHLVLKFRMEGSWILLFSVMCLAVLSHIAMGLLMSSRLKSEEVAGGVMNFITFPMMIFSGIFFSLEGAPRFLQVFSKVFPITHFLDASRLVMLEGAGFVQILPQLAVLAGSTVLFFILAAVFFKWE